MNLLQHRQGGEVIENEKSFDKYFFSNTYFFLALQIMFKLIFLQMIKKTISQK